MAFTVVVHHMGCLESEPKLHYKGGEVHVFKNLDVDTWSYFEAVGLLKELGYRDSVRLWWKPSSWPFEAGLKLLGLDKDALELSDYAIANKSEVDIYVEHSIDGPSSVREDGGDDEQRCCSR